MSSVPSWRLPYQGSNDRNPDRKFECCLYWSGFNYGSEFSSRCAKSEYTGAEGQQFPEKRAERSPGQDTEPATMGKGSGGRLARLRQQKLAVQEALLKKRQELSDLKAQIEKDYTFALNKLQNETEKSYDNFRLREERVEGSSIIAGNEQMEEIEKKDFRDQARWYEVEGATATATDTNTNVVLEDLSATTSGSGVSEDGTRLSASRSDRALVSVPPNDGVVQFLPGVRVVETTVQSRSVNSHNSSSPVTGHSLEIQHSKVNISANSFANGTECPFKTQQYHDSFGGTERLKLYVSVSRQDEGISDNLTSRSREQQLTEHHNTVVQKPIDLLLQNPTPVQHAEDHVNTVSPKSSRKPMPSEGMEHGVKLEPLQSDENLSEMDSSAHTECVTVNRHVYRLDWLQRRSTARQRDLIHGQPVWKKNKTSRKLVSNTIIASVTGSRMDGKFSTFGHKLEWEKVRFAHTDLHKRKSRMMMDQRRVMRGVPVSKYGQFDTLVLFEEALQNLYDHLGSAPPEAWRSRLQGGTVCWWFDCCDQSIQSSFILGGTWCNGVIINNPICITSVWSRMKLRTCEEDQEKEYWEVLVCIISSACFSCEPTNVRDIWVRSESQVLRTSRESVPKHQQRHSSRKLNVYKHKQDQRMEAGISGPQTNQQLDSLTTLRNIDGGQYFSRSVSSVQLKERRDAVGLEQTDTEAIQKGIELEASEDKINIEHQRRDLLLKRWETNVGRIGAMLLNGLSISGKQSRTNVRPNECHQIGISFGYATDWRPGESATGTTRFRLTEYVEQIESCERVQIYFSEEKQFIAAKDVFHEGDAHLDSEVVKWSKELAATGTGVQRRSRGSSTEQCEIRECKMSLGRRCTTSRGDQLRNWRLDIYACKPGPVCPNQLNGSGYVTMRRAQISPQTTPRRSRGQKGRLKYQN